MQTNNNSVGVNGEEYDIKPEKLIPGLEKALSKDYVLSVNYEKPTKSQLEIGTRLFTLLLSSRKVSENEISEWSSLGFSFEEVEEGRYTLGILSESIPKGHGCYAIKLKENSQDFNNCSSENILEAPHKPSDLFTDKIACQLFMEGDFSAVAFSTTHRKSVDLAREPDSFFNSFTEAVASVYKSAKIIQLHAFDATKHKLDSDLILSSTQESCGMIYDAVALSLSQQFMSEGFKISQFPKDVNILGGLKNINAKIFYKCNPEGSFFHVETSMKMRKALMSSQNLRRKFIEAFIKQLVN